MIRVPKAARNALLSAVAMLVLVVGGGVAYVWYSGQGGIVKPLAAAPVSDTEAPVIKPSKPSPNARESVAIESLTTPVAPGANSSLMIRTLAGSKCTISVLYNNVPSADSGLTPKVADEFGSVSWSWTVRPETPVGHAPVTVTCAYGQKTAVVQGDLVVTT